MHSTGSLSLMDRRMAFSSTLHPIMTEQEALDFALLNPRPFDCLVHLASNLLHPKNIIAGHSVSQIEQLLHIKSSSSMFSRILVSSLVAKTFHIEFRSIRPHAWW